MEPVEKSVLTVVENLYYREPGEEPVMTELSHSRILDSTDQAYERRLTATEKWMPLDCGWVSEASILIIRNREGYFPVKNPTEEEREQANKKVLDIAYFPQGDIAEVEEHKLSWSVPPKESMRGIPNNLNSLYIKSQFENTRFTLILYPK